MASTKKKTCSEKENGQNNPSLADDDMNMEQDVMDASDSMSSSSDEEEDEMDTQEKINVEFEARNPEEMDFHGIRQLLLQLFLKSNVHISGLTNWILSLNVGSVIKQYFEEDGEEEEEEDDIDYNQVYGVISCLNISNTKEKVFADQVKKHLLEKLSNEQQAVARLRSILDDPANNIGFIVNERFVNIPPQIAEPSFSSLRQEMQTANEKGDDYNCSHFVLIAKKFRMKVSGKSGKKRRSKKPLDPEIYSNAEEESGIAGS
ncbi:BRCA2 and CDKN1A-interacting protein-like isoform X2 [Watersipora subatra]|uniref:BRCA2 and CDKN1A-interacting protein-like isoform X2 n=1 Tax=Watersipora subatra TaxID=2589382 RepID=UPI00355BB83F